MDENFYNFCVKKNSEQILSQCGPGKIIFICGPMRSLKTSTLRKISEFYKEPIVNVEEGKSLKEYFDDKFIVLLDEIHFGEITSLLIKEDQIVILSGLLYDYNNNIFPISKMFYNSTMVFETKKNLQCSITGCKNLAQYDAIPKDHIIVDRFEKKPI